MLEVREKRSNANGMYANVHNFVTIILGYRVEKIPGKFSRYVGVACWIKNQNMPRRQRQYEFRPPPGASIRVLQNFNDKFFDVASKGDYKETYSRIKAGQDINVLHSYLKCSALQGAIDQGQRRIVRLLLEQGADPDLQNGRTGQTALHLCARRGDPELMHILLNAGANRKIEAFDGRLPIQLAAEYQWELAMNMLRDVPHQPLSLTPSCTNNSITLEWVPPPDNGTPIDRYELYWKPRRKQTIYATGRDPITKTIYWFNRNTGVKEGGLPDEGQQQIGEYDPFGNKNVDPVAEGKDYPLTQGGGDYNPEWNRLLNLTEPTWTLNNLPPNSQYYVAVRAHSDAGFSKFGRAQSIVTKDMVSTKPLHIRLSAATARMVSVNWTQPVDDRGGHVQFYELLFRKYLTEEQISQLATVVKIKAKEDDDDPYKNPKKKKNKKNEKQKEEDLKKVDEEEQHELEDPHPWISLSKKIPAPDWVDGKPGVPSFRANKLKPSTPYEFKVIAWNKTGWSEPSKLSPPIYTTTACKIIHSTSSAIIVQWNWKDGEDPILAYELQMYSLPIAKMCPKGDPTSSELVDRLGIKPHELQTLNWVTVSNNIQKKMYTVEGLLPARAFSTRVRCNFQSTGWTDWSESGESSVASTKADVPERPDPATFNGVQEHDKLSFQWTKPNNNGAVITHWELAYRILVGDDYDVEQDQWLDRLDGGEPGKNLKSEAEHPWTVVSKKLTDLEGLIENLHFGTEYEVAVRCANRCGWSQRSLPSKAKVTLAVEAPEAPYIDESNDSTAKICWNPPHITGMPIDMYELQFRIWRLDGGVLTPGEWIVMTRIESRVHLATSLVPTVVYQFRIRAHTYAAVHDAQWSIPGSLSEQIMMRRRL